MFTSVLYLDPNTSTKDTNSSGSLDNLCGVDTPSMPQGSDCTDSGHSGQTFVGGPTLVTDQVLGGPLAAKGWLSYPAVNRFTVFDGRYLHGEQLQCMTTAKACVIMECGVGHTLFSHHFPSQCELPPKALEHRERLCSADFGCLVQSSSMTFEWSANGITINSGR